MPQNSEIRDIFVSGLKKRPRDGKPGAFDHEGAAFADRELSEVAQRLEIHIRETEGQLDRLATISTAWVKTTRP